MSLSFLRTAPECSISVDTQSRIVYFDRREVQLLKWRLPLTAMLQR